MMRLTQLSPNIAMARKTALSLALGSLERALFANSARITSQWPPSSSFFMPRKDQIPPLQCRIKLLPPAGQQAKVEVN